MFIHACVQDSYNMDLKKQRILRLNKAHRASHAHSARVKILRFVTPIAAAVILLSLFIWPYLQESFVKTTSAPNGLRQNADRIVHNTLIKPKVRAMDSQGRPYEMAAKEAHQVSKNQADLVTPHGHVLLEDGTAVRVTSETGTYHANQKVLHHKENVHLNTSDGYDLEADKASVDFEKHVAQGDGHVKGQGPMGTVETESFALTQDGQLQMKGKSKLVINPKMDAQISSPAE